MAPVTWRKGETLASVRKRYARSKMLRKTASAKGGKSTFAKKVLAVVARKEETKYVANLCVEPGGTIQIGIPIASAVVTPANLIGLLPVLTQGVGENQRIGDRVSPVRARTTFTYYLSNTPNMFDVTMNLLILTVKGAQTAAAVAATPAASLLKVGNGGNADPNDPNQTNMLSIVNHYPVNTDQYTLCKWYKRRFAKGAGAINGAPGAAAEAGQIANNKSQQVIKYTWKPPTLKYDVAANNLPTNHYPVFITWATANDGSALQGTVLNYSARSELWFKDS